MHARGAGDGRLTLRAAPLALALALCASASGCKCVNGGTEYCFNFVDDDGDELADCYDGDCAASLYCICGITDPNCACPGIIPAPGPDASVTTPPPDASIPTSPPACIEVTCDDRTDNDRDELEDCDDPDCFPVCGVELGAWRLESADGAVPTTENLFAVWGASPTEVFSVGENGTILRYDGTSWLTQASPTMATLRDVTGTVTNISGETIAYAVGFDGTILRYQAPSNTVGTWNVETATDPMTGAMVTTDLHGVWTSVDGNIAWAVGDDGTLLFRNAATGAWALNPSPVQDNLYDVWGTGTGDVWAGGSFGVIVHYDGATWCEAVLGAPQIGINSNGAIRTIWGRGPAEIYFGAIGTVVLYDGMGPPCPLVGEANGYVDLSDVMAPINAPPQTQLLDIWGVGNDIFMVGIDGYLVHYNSAQQFFYYVWGDPPALPAYRFDGVWGYDPYLYYDSGVGMDSGVPDLGPPYDLWVVGATGTVLTGP